MLLQCLGGDHGIGLANAFPGLGHETRIARHEVLLWVVVRKVEGREGVLFGKSREIGRGLGCCRLEWCELWRPGRVDIISAHSSSYLVQLSLLVLLVCLKGGDGMVAILGIAGAEIVLDFRDKTCRTLLYIWTHCNERLA